MLRRLRIENLVLIREAELAFAPGLNAITGETGAGKTILAQAVGLLLGAKGDAAYVGPGAPEAYVEAELDLPDGLLEEDGFDAVRELRPEDEDGLVLARRVSAEGRTRAYAWGRAVPREELAALGERLIAMSGQFEQRRLARPAYQLEVLDSFIGSEQLTRRGCRAGLVARAPGRPPPARGADAGRRRSRGAARGTARARRGHRRPRARDGDALLDERERLRHVTELARARQRRPRRLPPRRGAAPPAWPPPRNARSRRSSTWRPSSRAQEASCETSSCACARRRAS